MWLLLVSILMVMAGILLLFGAPYVPTHSTDIRQLLKLAGEPGPKHSFVDLGAGDGRVVHAAAQAGWLAVGFELNPILWAVARWRCRKLANAKVVCKPWQKADLAQFDVLYIFGTGRIKNDTTLYTVKPQAKVISYGFKLPLKFRQKAVGPFWIGQM